MCILWLSVCPFFTDTSRLVPDVTQVHVEAWLFDDANTTSLFKSPQIKKAIYSFADQRKNLTSLATCAFIKCNIKLLSVKA